MSIWDMKDCGNYLYKQDSYFFKANLKHNGETFLEGTIKKHIQFCNIRSLKFS